MAANSDIVQLVVVDDAQVRSVVLDNDGVLSAAKPGSIIVVHATVRPQTCRHIASVVQEKNVGFLDAAVSGGEEGAKAGTLTLIVGGEAGLQARCQPVFDVLGDNIFHLGAVGMGAVSKLVNNMIFLNNLHGAYEGLCLGSAAGIDEDTLIEMIKVSTGDSWALESWKTVARLRETYTTGIEGMAGVLAKDLSLALSVGDDLDVPLPGTELTSERLHRILRLEG